MNKFGIAIDHKFQTLLALLMVPILILGTSCNNIQTWLNIANNALPELETEAQNIIAVADPADLTLAQNIYKGVSAGLKLVSDAVAAYKANPTNANLQNVAAALAQAANDLPALLNNVKFSDATVGLAIEAAVTGIVGVLDIVAANLPPATQTPANVAARSKRMNKSVGLSDAKKMLQPDALRAAWNRNVCDTHPTLQHCPRM